MKHIFVVHSNLTYLSALAVASLRGISDSDMLIVSQHYHRTVPVPVVGVVLFTRNIFRPARFFNFAWHTDRLVQEFTHGQTFELYVPAMTKPAKLFATHPLCRSVGFIEEGIGSYMRQFTAENHIYEYRTSFVRPSMSWRYFKSILTSLSNLVRGESTRLTAMPMNYTSYAGDPQYTFYGFHTAVFPLAPSRNILSMQGFSDRFAPLRTLDLSNKHILIGEGLFTLVTGYSLDEYISVLSDTVVPWLKERAINELYVKHHYNESPQSRLSSIEVFEKAGIRTNIIPDSTILETELIGTTNASLVGCSSSLLFYGALMGCKAYSYASKINHPLLDMEAYWREVTLI